MRNTHFLGLPLFFSHLPVRKSATRRRNQHQKKKNREVFLLLLRTHSIRRRCRLRTHFSRGKAKKWDHVEEKKWGGEGGRGEEEETSFQKGTQADAYNTITAFLFPQTVVRQIGGKVSIPHSPPPPFSSASPRWSRFHFPSALAKWPRLPASALQTLTHALLKNFSHHRLLPLFPNPGRCCRVLPWQKCLGFSFLI